MTTRLLTTSLILLPITALCLLGSEEPKPSSETTPPYETAPQYDEEGRLKFPTGYRTWVFAGASLGLEYRGDLPKITQRELARHKEGEIGNFHNVYINPEAYQHYKTTGEFPQNTVLVMDVYEGKERDPQDVVSKGAFPGQQRGVEVAVKNDVRPDDCDTDWAYYRFSLPDKPAVKAEPDRKCYACHVEHADDDNVWVQFYPTLRMHQRPTSE